MSIRADAVTAKIGEALAGHSKAFLAFSGGKDSVALAGLCEPYRDSLTLVWVNTGFMFPHMVEFVRGYAERFELMELKSDLMAHWRAFGLPVEIMAVRNAKPGGCHVEPQVQPWVTCCSVVRAQPLQKFIAEQSGATLLLHGQREEDRAPFLGLSGSPGIWPAGVSVVAPLSDWSEDDVMAYIAARGLRLPKQYPALKDSLECWPCPASFNTAGTKYVEFMAREYPEHLRVMLPGARKAHRAAQQSLDHLADLIEKATPQPAQEPSLVAQRGNGDCVIAAMATVAGLTYEDSATMLGWPCDANTGITTKPITRGINLMEICPALAARGFSATPLLSHSVARAMGPGGETLTISSDEIKRLIRGRRAVVAVNRTDVDDDRPHALAWIENTLLDCRDDDRAPINLADIDVLAAVLIEPLPELEASPSRQ